MCLKPHGNGFVRRYNKSSLRDQLCTTQIALKLSQYTQIQVNQQRKENFQIIHKTETDYSQLNCKINITRTRKGQGSNTVLDKIIELIIRLVCNNKIYFIRRICGVYLFLKQGFCEETT